MTICIRTLLTFAFLVTCTLTAQAENNWAGWRGPHGNGHSQEAGLPTKWSNESVTWKTRLKGRGQSSPTIWGERIFVTGAVENGRQRVVMCIDRNNGQILWQHVAWTGDPEPAHRMNGWASATCATDGEHVYAFFGRGGGLHCYTVEGKPVWQKDLGRFESPWGTAACPVIIRDMVIQNCDADKDAYIIALHKKTGEPIWKTKRYNARGWSTPLLIEAAGREELVINGDQGVNAYNPDTGETLWWFKNTRGRGTPTVTPAGDLLAVLCGRPAPIYAIRPGGNGDVTKSHLAWTTKRGGGRDLPSPIVIDNYILAANMKGIVACYDAKSGKELWQGRLGDARNISAAPTAFGGLAFFVDETGQTVAVKPGEKLDIVARNTVDAADDEIFRASAVPSDGQVFLRSDQYLYCIGKRK